MNKEERISWLTKRERECEQNKKDKRVLLERLTRLDREIKANEEERDHWQRYITWIKKPSRMEDPDAAIQACKTMQKELEDKYNQLIGERKRHLSKVKRITTLGNFMKWLKSVKANKS